MFKYLLYTSFAVLSFMGLLLIAQPGWATSDGDCNVTCYEAGDAAAFETLAAADEATIALCPGGINWDCYWCTPWGSKYGSYLIIYQCEDGSGSSELGGATCGNCGQGHFPH